MKPRHQAREVALQILYRYDVAAAGGIQPPQGKDLADDLVRHFEHFKVPQELRGFAAQLVSGTLIQLPVLDATVEKHASNWKVSRMNVIDRSLLRMAAYEMLHLPETPETVTIDEAIELAKQFGNADSPSFANGILDAIKKAKPAKTSS